jgi:glycerophosphoryl diester phosphodiesterase
MLAFQKAEEARADEIELDVQLTKDGTVVVIHDEVVDRTTDGTGSVRGYTFKELEKLDASQLCRGTCPVQRIPSFEEYCEWATQAHLTTNIELKTGLVYYQDIEKKTIAILEKYDLLGRVMFSSFNHLSLVETKRIAPQVPVGALIGKTGVVNAGFYCQKYGFEFYHPSFDSLDDNSVAELKAHHIGMNVWTVDGMRELEQLASWNVDGVITNYCTVCRQYLDGAK